MKKVLAAVLTICMVLSFVPAISFAADTTLTAVRTAFFNSSGSEWKLTDNSTGNDNVLVSTGADGWVGATSFTDSDGTVTTQSSLSGTGFGSARHALVAFTIPEDFDPDNTAKVTLGLTIKNVKQTTSGARLSVYGNSVDGTWSTSNSTSTFGVSGSNSGLTNLTLLGLTDAIQTGNQTGESASGETITLSSQKLTEYVCQMAKEGKTEVTFRLAAPLGGIRIYDTNTQTPPTLTIEEGKVATVTIKTVCMDGGTKVSSSSTTINNIIAGSTYTYVGTPAYSTTVNDVVYAYSAEDSILSTVVAADGTSEIVLVYNKYDFSNTFEGYEIDDEGAWCWFADPRSITYTNDEGTLDFSIIGYIDVHGDIKATQVNHLTDEVNEVLIRSNIQPDDHNNPTFLVLPDERIVVFYSRHTDERCFWYRVTKEPGDLTTLGEEKCLLTDAATTYPSPFIMENDPEHIYLMWRGVNWHPTCARLTMPDEDGNMSFDVQPFQVVSSTAQGSGCRPYAKYASDGNGKIYMTYTSTHPDNIYPVCIYYSCLDVTDFTLYDINGGVLKANINTSGPFTVNGNETNPSFVVDPSSTSQRGWVWQIALSEDGEPVIAMVRINQERSSHDYYYAKWNGTEWVKTFLANAGGAFHQSTNIGRELCYSGGMAIDPADTNVMYCSVPVTGVFGKIYEIVKYTMSDDGTEVLETQQITKNSMKNNVRPFVLPNSEDKDIRLIWMNGDYYDWIVSNASPEGYGTRVMAEAALPTETVDLSGAVIEEDYASIGGAFQSAGEFGNTIDAAITGDFTVSADVYLNDEYKGDILDLGEVSVSVERIATQYGATTTGDRARVVVRVGEDEYLSSNVYGSSDCWTTFDRGTGGNYGVEDYQDYVNLTLTYDGEYLTLYRYGLVDIKIPCSGISIDDIRVGSFYGMVENVCVYDRVLNHDEVKALAAAEYEVDEPDYEGNGQITVTYTDIDGSEIMETRTVELTAGTDYFKPVDGMTTEDGTVYALSEDMSTYGSVADGDAASAVYYQVQRYGENLAPGLDELTDALGNALTTWGTVTNANYSESGVAVHPTTLGGGNTEYTMRLFVPIEGGKKYIVTNSIYNNTGAATTSHNNAGMSAIIATGEAVYGTFNGLTMYSHVEYGGFNSWSNETGPIYVGSTANRTDYVTQPGLNKISVIINAPEDAKNIMISYGAWGSTDLYYGDFEVREIIAVETVDVTVDGEAVKTYGTLALGEEGQLPADVIGYHVTSGEETKFVNAGELAVEDGDVIATANINVEMVTGAQVRYGGGLDGEGKVSSGNGLRFIAQVDRSNVGGEVTGYGVEVKAEGNDNVVDIPAVTFQDAEETIFTAAITDLAASNYNRNFTATPYVTVQYADGTTAKIYGTESITRSIYQVAAGLLKEADSDIVDGGDDEYSAQQYGLYDVLNAYVNMVGIRLDMNDDGTFSARTEGKGAYTGDIFFDVATVKNGDVYTITITPVADFSSKVTIMSYWDEFIRINNNHTKVIENITNSVINEDGSVTFDFTVPAN